MRSAIAKPVKAMIIEAVIFVMMLGKHRLTHEKMKSRGTVSEWPSNSGGLP